MSTSAQPCSKGDEADPAARGMPPPGPGAAPPAGPALGATLHALGAELQAALHNRIDLLALETRQAGIATTQIVLLATLAALLLAAAWSTMMAGVYMACLAAMMPWPAALAVVLVINLAAAWAAWIKANTLTAHLTFPATRRMLRAGFGGGQVAAPGSTPSTSTARANS